MIRAALFLLLALVAPSLATAQPRDTCDWKPIVRELENMVALPALPPSVLHRVEKPLAVSLYEPIGATDEYLYRALLDPRSGQVWVQRHGGFSGAVVWYGPVTVAPGGLSSCPPAEPGLWPGVPPAR